MKKLLLLALAAVSVLGATGVASAQYYPRSRLLLRSATTAAAGLLSGSVL
jgi:hypothetical protein